MGDDSQHVFYEGHLPPNEQARLSPFHRLTRTRVGIVVFWTGALLISAFPETFCAILMFLARYFLPHIYVRWITNWVVAQWMFFFSRGFELFFGIRLRMFGMDSHQFKNHSIIIMNHRCHFDWFFFWLVMARRGNFNYWLAMVKSIAKQLPIFGWAMQWQNNLFLTRQWTRDKDEIYSKLNYVNWLGGNFQLLIFPEGTDLNPEHKRKGDRYADSMGWPHYSYCLHPKSTGFLHAFNILKQGKLEAIYDVTVGYPDVLAQTEVEYVMKGRIPREIHYHIKEYDIKDLPDGDEELEKWLRQVWKEKEARLKLFYRHSQFREIDENETILPPKVLNGDFSVVSRPASVSPEVIVPSPFRQYFISIMFFVTTLGSSVYLTMQHWIGWAIFFASCLNQLYLTHFTTGIDYAIMSVYGR